MAYDRAASPHQAAKEREAGERAGDKRLDKKGHPQALTSAERRDAANHTRMAVTKNPEPTPHEIKRTMGED